MVRSLRLRLLAAAAVTGLLGLCAFAWQVPVWQSAAPIPTPVRAGNTAAYSQGADAWLLIVSGRDQNSAIVKTVQRYSVSTNTWDTLAPHPTGLLGAATAVLRDSLYLIGGVVSPPGAGLNSVSKLSISQNQWSTVAQLPITLADAKAVAYQDSLIFVAGGVGGPNRGNVYLYNARSNSWRTATPFNAAGRRSFGGFAVSGDTLVYLCGTAAFGSSVTYDSVYVGLISQSNRAVITWTRGANFPGQTRSFFDAHDWGRQGIIMTGGSTDNTLTTSSAECYRFSPGKNQWTQLPDKPTAWLTGQSATVQLPGQVRKLICTSGYANGYLSETEILTDTLLATGRAPQLASGTAGIRLLQPYPNPFPDQAAISYELAKPCHISVMVFDATGREVATLVQARQMPGRYTVHFDGRSHSSGTYFVTFRSGPYQATQRLQLTR